VVGNHVWEDKIDALINRLKAEDVSVRLAIIDELDEIISRRLNSRKVLDRKE
jgi:hypothetical protein